MTATDRYIAAGRLAGGPPPLPAFAWRSAPDWAISRIIDVFLGHLRLPDGTGPVWTRYVAPALTYSRFGFPIYALAFLWFVMAGEAAGAWTVFGVIVAAYATDAIDGSWARYWHCTTPRGAQLDPIADKIAGISMLLVWGFLLLAYAPQWTLWAFGLMASVRILEDVILAAMAYRELRLATRPEDGPKAGPWGKVKSAADVAGVMAACLAGLLYVGGSSGAVLMLVAFGFLAAAIALAPLSIREHRLNLRR